MSPYDFQLQVDLKFKINVYHELHIHSMLYACIVCVGGASLSRHRSNTWQVDAWTRSPYPIFWRYQQKKLEYVSWKEFPLTCINFKTVCIWNLIKAIRTVVYKPRFSCAVLSLPVWMHNARALLLLYFRKWLTRCFCSVWINVMLNSLPENCEQFQSKTFVRNNNYIAYQSLSFPRQRWARAFKVSREVTWVLPAQCCMLSVECVCCPNMKIVTWNINGIRTFKNRIKSALDAFDADIICVQETKVTRK